MPDDIMQVKTIAENLGRAFEEFKGANDARIKEIEKKGAADAVTTEKVDKLNEQITKLQDDLEKAQKGTEKTILEMQKTIARPGHVGGGAQLSEEEVAHKSAFSTFLRKGKDADLRDLQIKAMSVGSDPDGGYMVPTEMSSRIVTRSFDTTPMRQLATIMQTNSDAIQFPRDTDEVDAQWAGEVSSRVDTNTAQVGMIRIPVHELYAQPKVSQQLLDDAMFDVETWLANKVADKFSRKENNAFINGDGVTQPRGIVSYATAATADATRSWGVIEHVASGASGAFAGSNPSDKLFDLVAALKVAYLPGSWWITPRAVVKAIRQFKESTTNAYMWQPGLQLGQPDTLLGYPIMKSEDMPALAANSLSLAFGNFKEAYTIVDRVGIRMLRDPYTAPPFVRFRSSKRTGGDITNFEAVKLMKFA